MPWLEAAVGSGKVPRPGHARDYHVAYTVEFHPVDIPFLFRTAEVGCRNNPTSVGAHLGLSRKLRTEWSGLARFNRETTVENKGE